MIKFLITIWKFIWSWLTFGWFTVEYSLIEFGVFYRLLCFDTILVKAIQWMPINNEMVGKDDCDNGMNNKNKGNASIVYAF